MAGEAGEGEERLQYGNQLELILTLVSYAVGIGNLWRFPYLVYENGGGTFLIPYVVALVTLGLPIFALELGLGQMLRQGPINIWIRMGLPRFRAVGVAAIVGSLMVTMYYLVIVAWTTFYIGSLLSTVSSGILPWEDTAPGFQCREAVLIVMDNTTQVPDLWTNESLFNPIYRSAFMCPSNGRIPDKTTPIQENYTMMLQMPNRCPGQAALTFWTEQALQKSDDITNLGGIVPGMLASHTIVWIVLYIMVFRGVVVSGKLAYVTATLPYLCLICFFFGSIVLENSVSGLLFYLTADVSKLWDPIVWQKAATQIFFSLGIGWGSIIAFGSYGNVHADFVGHVTKVCLINCGTSVFGGFVVFSVLGFLAGEMSKINPCFSQTDISALEAIGLQGSGLAFVAFPIAIGQMSSKFFWAFVFFIMLFTLGIGSGFGFVETVVTCIFDSGAAGPGRPRWQVAGIVCLICYISGLLFVTRAGEYWVKLFDSYTTVVASFAVCFFECVGIMWMSPSIFENFKSKALKLTGKEVPDFLRYLWGYIGPIYTVVLLFLSFSAFDLTGNAKSGEKVFPQWVLWFGWLIGFIPILAAALTLLGGPVKLPDRPNEMLQEVELNEPLDKVR